MVLCDIVRRSESTITVHEYLTIGVFLCLAIPRVYDAITHLQKFITMPERQKIKVCASRARGLQFRRNSVHLVCCENALEDEVLFTAEPSPHC